ncbi:MAG TPA: hypothetical protein VJM32_00500 [Candidatus Saccharimonadales bacterium]|nr:hypothetical protein [Candidatus Saccharimonadales bacterium]
MNLHEPKVPFKIKIILGTALVMVAGIGTGVGFGWYSAQRSVELPGHVLGGATFDVHLPKELPPGYAFVPKSTALDEGVLAYVATKGRAQIIFSEQLRPADKKIEDFHTENMSNRTTLTNVPHRSVIGDSVTGGHILSIVTDTTWLIVSTTAVDADSILRFIAQKL